VYSKELQRGGNGKAWKKLVEKKNNRLMKKKEFKWLKLIGMIL
jgi:hypothetical protein